MFTKAELEFILVGMKEDCRVLARYNKSAVSEDGNSITIVYMDDYNSIGD